MGKNMKPSATLAERLENGTVQAASGCRLWVKAVDDGGYGMLTYQGKSLRAHIAAWIIATGSKPEATLDHTCFNRACCAVEHLRPATYKQNNEHLQGAQRNSKTGLRGVTLDQRRGKYRATVTHNYRQYWCGYHDTAEQAAAAAAAKRDELFTHHIE